MIDKLLGIWVLPHSRCTGVVVRHIASPFELISKNAPEPRFTPARNRAIRACEGPRGPTAALHPHLILG